MSDKSDLIKTMGARLGGDPAPSPIAAQKIVKVWVRLGTNENENERTLAFWLPKDIDHGELLERGAAIDGTQAVISVYWDPVYGFNHDGKYVAPDLNDSNSGEHSGESLTRVLRDCQRSLVKYLAGYGYKVQFE